MSFLRGLLTLTALTIGLFDTNSLTLADPIRIGSDIPYDVLDDASGGLSLAALSTLFALILAFARPLMATAAVLSKVVALSLV